MESPDEDTHTYPTPLKCAKRSCYQLVNTPAFMYCKIADLAAFQDEFEPLEISGDDAMTHYSKPYAIMYQPLCDTCLSDLKNAGLKTLHGFTRTQEELGIDLNGGGVFMS